MAGQTSVKPLLATSVDWLAHIKNVAELVGRSPTRGIDDSGLKLSNHAIFLASLAEFHSGKPEQPLDILRNDNMVLRHLFFGFLISGTKSMICRIMEMTDLDITTTNTLADGRAAVVTGTLQVWKSAIVICLHQQLDFDLRCVFNKCLDVFFAAGLQNVFADYRKTGLPDKTYLLEYRE